MPVRVMWNFLGKVRDRRVCTSELLQKRRGRVASESAAKRGIEGGAEKY